MAKNSKKIEQFLDVSLFLGFPVDASLAAGIEKLDQRIAQLFIDGKEFDYLKERSHQNMRYLGKFADVPVDVNSLFLLEANIYSLLKKIFPQYSTEEISLVLFPVRNK